MSEKVKVMSNEEIAEKVMQEVEEQVVVEDWKSKAKVFGKKVLKPTAIFGAGVVVGVALSNKYDLNGSKLIEVVEEVAGE